MSDTLPTSSTPVRTDRIPLESSLNFEFDRLATLGYAQTGPPPRNVGRFAAGFMCVYGLLALVTIGIALVQARGDLTSYGFSEFFGNTQRGRLALWVLYGIHALTALVMIASALGCLMGRNARRMLVASCLAYVITNMTSVVLGTTAAYLSLKRNQSFNPGFSAASFVLATAVNLLFVIGLPLFVAVLLMGRQNDPYFERRD